MFYVNGDSKMLCFRSTRYHFASKKNIFMLYTHDDIDGQSLGSRENQIARLVGVEGSGDESFRSIGGDNLDRIRR
jgi:hypothetical protein